MKVKKAYIRKYDWDVRIYYDATYRDAEIILEDLKRSGCPDKFLARARKNLSSGKLNNGLTYSNKLTRESIVVIGRWSHKSEFENTLSHELTHLTDHIAETFGIDRGGEDMAYMVGELRRDLFQTNKKYLCGR